jgi:hypothetical protein
MIEISWLANILQARLQEADVKYPWKAGGRLWSFQWATIGLFLIACQ